ncbi:MAG: TauD/TfdA family dioxygenase [Magnetovibrio sp.]|nr:TauD/TfdA family dioxygenase [Magnetovibrio sp.]
MSDVANSQTGITVAPVAGALGAEVSGVDLGAELGDAEVAAIREALLQHCVIFFRDQVFDTEAHKRLARRFGDIFVHPFFISDGDPEIVTIVREPGDTRIVGEDWHSDTQMMAEPPMGAILIALEVPEYGGDTLFANQYLAYEALSDGMKRMLDGLKAVNSDRLVAGPAAAERSASRATKARTDDGWRETANAHPVVRTHPETGRKALYVNHSYTIRFDGMSEDESRPLLDWLMDWGHRPEFTCRFRWRAGSVAFWDNRCSKHIAVDDIRDARRIMRRVQIAGDRPY